MTESFLTPPSSPPLILCPKTLITALSLSESWGPRALHSPGPGKIKIPPNMEKKE